MRTTPLRWYWGHCCDRGQKWKLFCEQYKGGLLDKNYSGHSVCNKFECLLNDMGRETLELKTRAIFSHRKEAQLNVLELGSVF